MERVSVACSLPWTNQIFVLRQLDPVPASFKVYNITAISNSDVIVLNDLVMKKRAHAADAMALTSP